MGTHLLRRKAAGQSIILIAFIIAVLVGMVGLSVDVGNAYAEQRAAQRAANSAAIKGADSLIKGRSDDDIYKDLIQTLEANGMNMAPKGSAAEGGQTALTAFYLDEKGNVVGPVGGTSGSRPPSKDVTYVQVTLNGKTTTYLARVFGQDTLPVNVETYGGRGPCSSGVYPLAVEDRVFKDAVNDVDQGGTYNDSFYLDKPWRRVYLKENSPLPGGFSWLRWQADPSSGSAKQMALDWTGAGTIDQGFEEAPWQNGTEAGSEPQDYPYLEGYINTHDWVYGSTGLANSIKDELDTFIKHRTEVILPFFDVASGNGANSYYHVSGLGRFLILEYGQDKNHHGNPHYIDLVYLGPNDGCPMTVDVPRTECPPDATDCTATVDLVGEVKVKPRYTTRAEEQPPVDLVFVLDESGSMGWTWHTNDKNGNTNASSPDAARYIVVRSVLKQFVNDFMTEDDRIAITTYSGNNGNAIYNENQAYTQAQIDNAVKGLTEELAPYSKGDAAGKAYLLQQIDKYGAGGSTPSVVGLERGRRALQGARTSDWVGPPGNQKLMAVKKVLILMTDGVANVYKDGKFYPCLDKKGKSENCVNELTAVGQPIHQMATLANQIKASYGSDLTVYTIAMGPLFSQAGLINTASQPKAPYFNTADQISDMGPIFRDIKAKIKEGECQPNEEAVQSPVDTNRIADDGVIGKVTLILDGNPYLTSDIQDQNGVARYTFNNIKPGTYALKGWVRYKGKDNVYRIYDLVSKNGSEDWASQVPFQVDDAANGIGRQYQGPELHFDLSASVCQE